MPVDAAKLLPDLLDRHVIREVEPGLFSVLPSDAPGQRYDGRARAYDRMIGNELYNRLFWGSSPADYRAFAAQAVDSSPTGLLLDAGCGTMLLSAHAYASSPHRPVVALDQSLDMLRRSRERLAEAAGGHPEHVVFLQADLLDLPFRAGTFQTVLSMGMLHLFERVEPLLARLRDCLEPGGQIFLTSLVENGRFGDRYMRFLCRAGEIAAPRASSNLKRVLDLTPAKESTFRVTGNMAYATRLTGH